MNTFAIMSSEANPDNSSSSNRAGLQQTMNKVISSLRAKKRDVMTDYQNKSRKLMRSFELSSKEEIIEYARNEYECQQKKELLERLTRDATMLSQDFQDFVKNYESPPYIDKYSLLISASNILGINEISTLQSKLPIKKPPQPYELKTFANDKEAGLYIRKFAEEKGSSQGANERLLPMFK